MSNYTGSECLVCGEKFKDGDEIVVCPECGTPYHRECYSKEGKCINYKLHDSGVSWAQEKEKERLEKHRQQNELKCPRCGAVNSEEDVFCPRCGLPRNGAYQDRPFNEYGGQPFGGQYGRSQNTAEGGYIPQGMFDPFASMKTIDLEEEVDDIKVKDYTSYVGANWMYYIPQFLRFSKQKIKRSFNLAAFFFPEIFYFYRKMIGQGIFFMTLRLIATVLTQGAVLYFGLQNSDMAAVSEKIVSSPLLMTVSFVLMAIYFVCLIISGIMSNFWYFKKAKRDIKNIKSRNSSLQDQGMEISSKGGTSFVFAAIAFAAYYIISQLIYIVMK